MKNLERMTGNTVEAKKMRTNTRILTLVALVLTLCLFILSFVAATPTGATITYNSTDNGPTSNAGNLTTNRSTITTVVLNAVQQDQHWKAYVGNVTGSFTLQDSGLNTIYNWPTLAGSVAGKVLASRNNSLNFANVTCANTSVIAAEQTTLNMSATDADCINKTFNSTAHTPTYVASQLLSNCSMTSTYVNSASQGQNASASFQEFLIQDTNANLVYVSIINSSRTGYNGKTYDFQMLVADSNIQAAHTYYFYVELG